MAWYKTGTVSVTNGATSVTGKTTRFASNARVGDAFRGPDGEWYEVVNIASETVLGIYPAYQGSTLADSNLYVIAPMQGYVKESADRLRAITEQLKDFNTEIAEAKAAADEAKVSAAEALASQTASKTSETNSKTSETNSKASENAAKTSETNAKASETSATASKNAAAASQSAALASQTAAKTSETNSKTSETNAKASENAAAASKTAAETAKTAAETARTAALNAQAGAQASQTAAKTSETNAKTSETNSKTSENNAKASETAAKLSETNSKASETKAMQWAENPVDTAVETGKYSSKHWATKAAESAAQAGTVVGPRLTSIAQAVMAVNDILIADTTTTMKALATGTVGRALLFTATPSEARTVLQLGTAAQGTITTSNIDSTAGRLLKVGDFGLGNTNNVSITGTQLDSTTLPTGMYRLDVAAAGYKGLPIGAYGIWNNRLNDTTGVAQIAINFNTATMYFRSNTSNDFRQQLATNDFGLGSYTAASMTDMTVAWNSGFYNVSANAAGLPPEIAATGGIFIAMRTNFGILLQTSSTSSRRMYHGARGGSDGAITWREVLHVGDLGGLGTTAMATNITDFLSDSNVTGPIRGAFSTTANSPTTQNEGFGGWCVKYTASVAFYYVVSGTNKAWFGYKQSTSTIVWSQITSTDYGYGGTLSTTLDANSLTASGMYATGASTVGSPGYTGGPQAGQQGYLEHLQHGNSLYATQRWTQLNSVNAYTRCKFNGTWTGWTEWLINGDAVTINTAQDITGQKTFYGQQVRHKSSTPGFWMSPTDTSLDDIWMVMSGNNLQWQRRANGFTSTLKGSNPLTIDLNTNLFRVGYQLTPLNDNALMLGGSGARWSVVYSATGTINTSDGREKTSVTPMSDNQIAAAKAISKEVGTYKWLKSIEEKGDDARKHVGMTVQRAIEIMEEYNLDPFEYGFICYDSWDGVEEVSHTERRGYTYSLVDGTTERSVIIENVVEEGNAFPDTGVFWEYTHDERVVTVPGTPAGDRYSFRYDELNLFISTGLNAENEELRKSQSALEDRISKLEAMLNA